MGDKKKGKRKEERSIQARISDSILQGVEARFPDAEPEELMNTAQDIADVFRDRFGNGDDLAFVGKTGGKTQIDVYKFHPSTDEDDDK